MSDSSDVVQRGNDSADTKPKSVVDLGHNAPKQDLWDIDDDIFKPLLERIEAERVEEARELAAEKTKEQSENYVGSFGGGGGHQFSISPDLGLISRDHASSESSSSEQNVVAKPTHRRKSVLDNGASPVTIRSELPTMPRVVWNQQKNAYKKAAQFIEKLPSRVQWVLAAVSMFVIWNIVALLTARTISLELFQYDPFYMRNWEQLYKLYQNGSTFQWSFVLFYLTMFVITPLFGILLAIKAAGEFRPVIKAIISPIAWIAKLALKIMGLQNNPAPIQRTMPVYAPVPGGRGGYHGATFKKDASEDDTGTGGSIGGGSGGGHGRPSWQGGPANTQAFPRSEQGRR